MREMKDSGIEWIGDIPEHWETVKIKYLTTIRSEKGIFDPKSDIYIGLENIMSYKNDIITTDTEYITSIYDVCKKGDILFSKLRPYLVKVIIAPFDCFCTGELMQFKSFDGNKRYFWYWLQNSCFIEVVNASTYGSKMPRANPEFILNLSMLRPPLPEQQQIANYLDRKCAEIDSLVSDIQRQIELLEEYKRSVITEAVTKGLDKNAPMKNSGIEWIGDIPEHWEVHPLYFYFGERKHKNAFGLETNLLSLSYGKIIRKDINSNGGLLPESFNTYNIVEKDDIIIRPTDLQNDKRSLRTGISAEHGIITSAYIAMKAIKPVIPQYFHYLLHTYDVMKVFYNMGNGVRQGLNFSEFSNLMVFEPTIEEQNAIVAYLQKKCDEIDLAISEKKQQLEAIEGYKKSLIFEYVTGKREVK